MGKVGAAILGAMIGGFAAVAAIIFWFGWGLPGQGQAAHTDPTRADYVDLLLAVATMFLGAVGVTVTVGALVIGVVALRTLREIKDEAADRAKDAAADKIKETMAAEVQTALLNGGLGHKILSEMARQGELDEALQRVVVKVHDGGPEPDKADE